MGGQTSGSAQNSITPPTMVAITVMAWISFGVTVVTSPLRMATSPSVPRARWPASAGWPRARRGPPVRGRAGQERYRPDQSPPVTLSRMLT